MISACFSRRGFNYGNIEVFRSLRRAGDAFSETQEIISWLSYFIIFNPQREQWNSVFHMAVYPYVASGERSPLVFFSTILRGTMI